MEYSIRYEQARNDETIMVLNNFYIHSKYNPTNEAKQIVKEKYKPHQLHIVFGYGTGYIVKELIRFRKFKEPILILDPLIDEGIIDVPILNEEKVYFSKLDDKRSLVSILNTLISDGNLVLIPNKNYSFIFGDIYKEALNAIQEVQRHKIINFKTIDMFAKKWQLNHFFSIGRIFGDLPIEILEKKYSSPVVVASGGPSLTKQFSLLKKYRKKIILICAGSTINTLLREDIEPDYIVSVDGGEANYEHFKELKLKNAQLIYSTMHHYKINDSFEKRGLPFLPKSHQQINSYLEERFQKKLDVINGGGSVAHYALEIAKKFTTGPIALIGQDLAYTNNQTHADGNKHFKKIEQTTNLIDVEGYVGGTVKTSISLNAMINSFVELQISSSHEHSVYNCTEGGAKIKGYDQIPFSLFLEKYSVKDVEIFDFEETFKDNEFDMLEYYQSELSEYSKLIELLKQGDNLVESEAGPLFKVSTLKKLDKLDKKLHAKYDYLELNTLLDAALLIAQKKFLPKVDETPQEAFDRIKEYTLYLYRYCREVIQDYKETIEKIIAEQEELKDVTK